MSCLFCKIANREIPAKIAYEDDDTVAFHDINPVAPTHVLVIPRKHIVSLTEATEGDEAVLGKLLLAAKRVAQAERRDGPGAGYRVVINSGPNAGQTVFHIHVHVIGGRPMGWPPG
jgi:histidine triad (HIT) family protein